MTDHQLQILLAAKLPEKIGLFSTGLSGVRLTADEVNRDGVTENDWCFGWLAELEVVRPTEWDYIVRLVEEGMNNMQFNTYHSAFWNKSERETMTASWQQRATAMKECGII